MTDLALRASEVPAEFDRQMHMATVLSESDLLPRHLRGKPANVLVILQGARALDVSAFWAFQSMHVIEGKLGMSADLMRALAVRAGHTVRVVERSAARGAVEIHRKDRDSPYLAEFTWDDAKTAGLTAKENWRKYPKAMMVARATAIAVRDECPEVLFGVVYTPDELGVTTDVDGNPSIPGEVVEGREIVPPTDDEITLWATSVNELPIEELPALWAAVAERGAQFARVPESQDDSLADWFAYRLADEADSLNQVVEIRELWRLGAMFGVLDTEVTSPRHGSPVPLAQHLHLRVSEIQAPPVDESEAHEAPSEAIEGEMVEIDTENARALREAATASWGDSESEGRAEVGPDVPGPHGAFQRAGDPVE